MKLTTWCAVGLAAVLTAACDQTKSEEGTLESRPEVGEEDGRPRVITASGCVTASGERFVLTDLKGQDGSALTETYRLVGDDEDIRPHVGKMVQVTGASEPEQIVDVRQSTGSVGTGGAAQVDTTETTRIEVTDLTVRSIAPTGEPCPTN
jgi:hypothetical protein